MAAFTDLIPVPVVASEEAADGRLILLRPKFVSPRLQWLQRMLNRPYFRVKLDGVGACVWTACDGKRSVGDIYGIVRARFGEGAEPVEERTGRFIAELARGRFLRLDPPVGAV